LVSVRAGRNELIDAQLSVNAGTAVAVDRGTDTKYLGMTGLSVDRPRLLLICASLAIGYRARPDRGDE
jgi:hypothetical protein